MDKKRQELTEINQQRKALVKRQKELLRELHENKGSQVEAKKILSEKRKIALAYKTQLRTLLGKTKELLKSKDSAEINQYAEAMTAACELLLNSLKEFAEETALQEDL